MMSRNRLSWRGFIRACQLDGTPPPEHLAGYLSGRGPEDQTLVDAIECVRAVLDRPARLAPGDTLTGDILDLIAMAVEGRNARERLSRSLHPSHPAMCRTLAACAQMCHRAEQAEAALADRTRP
jgi:hypothetical protein